jgi:hypothetical protein
MSDANGELILYRTEDGRADIQLRAVDGTVWLSQGGLAQHFETSSQNVTQHIRHDYEEAELVEEATCKDYLQVQVEGGGEVRRQIKLYLRPDELDELNRLVSGFRDFAEDWALRRIETRMTEWSCGMPD